MSTGCLQTATPCIMGDVNFGSLTTNQTTCPLNFHPLRLPLLQQHSQSQNLISGVKTFYLNLLSFCLNYISGNMVIRSILFVQWQDRGLR